MKRKLSIVLAVVLTVILLLLGSASVVYAAQVSKSLEMEYYCVSSCWCGPSSGTSIGQYYEEEFGIPGYWDLPSPPDKMYNQLYQYMDTFLGYTSPSNYGPGFVELALHYGYDNFGYEYYGPDTDVKPGDEDFYMNVIKNAIYNDWPIALAALNGFDNVDEIETDGSEELWPCTSGHWIAIKGYEYSTWYGETWNHHIICTDSYSRADNLKIDWDDVVANVDEDDLYVVVIKDEDDTPDSSFVEDFEWGSDGMDLEYYWQEEGGEVDWEVTASGASVVEIDDAEHAYGTKSARFCTYTSTAQAYYSLIEPSFIGFALKKDNNAEAKFINGNGEFTIWVRVNGAEQVQYYDGSWHTVYTIPYQDDWCLIEFDDFDWDDGTFDIWVNYYKRKDDADMRTYSSYNGIFKILNPVDYSQFWIDRIDDSLV